MTRPQIEVVGLKDLQKQIRKTGDEDLKKAMKATKRPRSTVIKTQP